MADHFLGWDSDHQQLTQEVDNSSFFLQYDDPSHLPLSLDLARNQSTSPSDALSDIPLEEPKRQSSKKRRQESDSDCSRPGGSPPTRKTRKLQSPTQTAKVRKRGACFSCKKRKGNCLDGNDPKGPCRPCLEHFNKITIFPGLLLPLCWRPNIRFVEVFRRGPTLDFAASRRGNKKDAAPGKQALWKTFHVSPHGNKSAKIIEITQSWTSNVLRLRLDRYRPKDTDKQYYSWFDDGVEKRYPTPPYGIADLDLARSALERFLRENFEGYINTHLWSANEITRKTFQTAVNYKNFPLVESALKLWVGCRFIEKPWSIVGLETLGLSADENPNCPYNDRIPVPPIVDQQIDLLVINVILQPELKKILARLETKLQSNDSWTDWFEIYLATFILLHNVELTMAHDAWFVRRHNVKTKYSNKPLVDTITQGATILLTCFHYAHRGYAPFSNPELTNMQQWPEEEKRYIQEVRPMLQWRGQDYAHDPAKEMFWTSQLHRPDWRPVVLVS